jgi:acetylornithine deacetylase/succinyl-diaminopimelate desuccinylase-like protein
MIVAARNSSIAASDFKTTVGTLTVEPGSNNVIAHAVTFNLDIRAADDDLLDNRLAGVSAAFEEIAAEEGAQVEMDLTFALPCTSFDKNIRERLQRAAEERGVRWAVTPGHIGHDSLYLAALGPTAMLFTRTDKGLSHCEEESAPWDAVVATAGVYADVTLALARCKSLPDLVSPQKLRENA